MQCGRITAMVIRRVSKMVTPIQTGLDPTLLVKNDISTLFSEIQKDLSLRPTVKDVATYYFDATGKAVRPMLCFLMSRAVNSHVTGCSSVLHSQREIAKITEMIHVASLLHDDVVDGSEERRGKASVHFRFSHKEAVMGGDFILYEAIILLSRLKNNSVLIMLSQALVDLVQGEFMQLNQKKDEQLRFPLYLQKTFNKTASLIAHSCKSVALLSGADEEVQEVAYQYGRNCGIAFQLIDDVLDFTLSRDLGKPTFSDLRSGVTTAPILFACEKFPEMNTLINRRFKQPGDVEHALDLVYKSNGLEQTKLLAQKHCQEAIDRISLLKDSEEKKALVFLTTSIVHRKK